MSVVRHFLTVIYLFLLILYLQNDDQEDLKPSQTPGYKPTAAKTAEEYAKLDAEDESLARWKASLGIVPGISAGDTSGPKVTVLTLELDSPTLPPGKKLVFDVADTAKLADTKKNPIIIKEGVEYNVRITFRVNHSIISGVRYLQVVKRAGIAVDKMEQMLGSYGPHPNGEPYAKNFEPEESPSGTVARMGSFSVRSRVLDDDDNVYADWEWSFKLAKEW
ncbi:E set domain-containing protein [Gyrodon lividus]|nr:E set domain-containing protein [Gyrodon lividus]